MVTRAHAQSEKSELVLEARHLPVHRHSGFLYMRSLAKARPILRLHSLEGVAIYVRLCLFPWDRHVCS